MFEVTNPATEEVLDTSWNITMAVSKNLEAERVNCSNAVKPSGKSIHSMLDLVQ